MYKKSFVILFSFKRISMKSNKILFFFKFILFDYVYDCECVYDCGYDCDCELSSDYGHASDYVWVDVDDKEDDEPVVLNHTIDYHRNVHMLYLH